MTEDAKQFWFAFWAVTRPDDPYYYTNWGKAVQVEVVANNRQEAINLADKAMGEAGRGRHWVFKTISVRDALLPPKEKEKK